MPSTSGRKLGRHLEAQRPTTPGEEEKRGGACVDRASEERGREGAGVVQSSLTMEMMMSGCRRRSCHRPARTGLAPQSPAVGNKMVCWGGCARSTTSTAASSSTTSIPAAARHPCEWQPQCCPRGGNPHHTIHNHPWDADDHAVARAGRLTGSNTAPLRFGESLPQSLNCRMHPCCHHALAHAQAAGPYGGVVGNRGLRDRAS